MTRPDWTHLSGPRRERPLPLGPPILPSEFRPVLPVEFVRMYGVPPSLAGDPEMEEIARRARKP